jgi:Protein of unknown function (DUF1761)
MDTAFLSQLNWLAILVAAVAYFMLGALWYSKLLFANTWIKSTGVDMNNPLLLFLSLLFVLVSQYWFTS